MGTGPALPSLHYSTHYTSCVCHHLHPSSCQHTLSWWGPTPPFLPYTHLFNYNCLTYTDSSRTSRSNHRKKKLWFHVFPQTFIYKGWAREEPTLIRITFIIISSFQYTTGQNIFIYIYIKKSSNEYYVIFF